MPLLLKKYFPRANFRSGRDISQIFSIFRPHFPETLMNQEQNFDDIRPYYDHEAHDVLQRMIKDPLFMKLVEHLWPGMSQEEVKQKADKVNSALGFQLEFMHPAIRTIVSRSSTGLSSSGFENLQKDKSYLFVANHRDILLDSAILQILLVENGFSTSEITFGNNLMEAGFITDFGRINRMFTVQREGTSRELYDISRRLSAYIRHTIAEKKVSVWIAQRNGRSKDGNDFTQTGLLKMLNISGKGNFEENFAELNIVPLTISYEYEPCDYFKAQELHLSSLHSKYIKAPGEDFNSIITGILQPKGRIHLAVGTPVVSALSAIGRNSNENDRIKQLTAAIDQQIYRDYKLWPVNYIAADLAEESSQFSSHYTPQEKEDFIEYIKGSILRMKGDVDALFPFFLRMYSNPLKNKIQQTVQA
jgi:hypothetical protein